MTTPRRIALVTGAGSGIGRAVALALQREGWTVVLAGRRLAALEATARQATMGGGEMLSVTTDVARPESVAALFAGIASRYGRLDLLFNNAGVFTPAVPFEEIALEDWRQCVDINLTGAFLCAQHAVRMMKAQSPQGGRIINNGSISAHAPRPHSAPYTATKHALSGLTKSIALDGRPYAIACGQIDIGNARTEMTEGIAQGAMQADGRRLPEPTMDVAHVADAVVYMAGLPLEANVLFMTVMASAMPFVGRG
jgi:NAD(P)-dependent dehydrogenase (short-subunit alcohol dehydrogenase family)